MTAPGFTNNPDDIGGIKPEDVLPRELRVADGIGGDNTETLVRQALVDLEKAALPQKEEDDRFELTDGELVKALGIFEKLAQKYQDKPRTFETFQSLRREAIEKFDKIGLVIEVDTLKSDLTGEPPTIEIVNRKGPIDLEEYMFDIGSGVADPIWESRRKKNKKK